MKTHTPSLSGLPLCGEAQRWRSKRARAYRMAEPGAEPTCGHCLHVLDGYGETRADRWIAHAGRVLDRWRANALHVHASHGMEGE